MHPLPTNYYPSTILCQFTQPAFIENICGDDDGNLYVTNVDEGAVYKVDPEGNTKKYASTAGHLTGIVPIDANTFLCGGWDAKGVSTIFLLDTHQRLIPKLGLPDALFLNGIAPFGAGRFLICDAYSGLIWCYNIDSNVATPWLRHELLTRLDKDNPMPAANGIKVFGQSV